MDRSPDHVVVLGASMAGLLAARVLTAHYQRVTIVERDELPPVGQHRKGVPPVGTCTDCTRAAGPLTTACSRCR